MTVEQLRAMHQARPFRPFRMHMADGRSIDVEHPEIMALSPGGRTVSVATSEHAFEVIDLLLVTALVVLNGAGARPKRRPPRR